MSDRGDRLSQLLDDEGLDLMLVTDLVNVRYLTGFTGSNGLALVGPQTRTFVTDFRYVDQAAEEVDAAYERRRAAQELLDAAVEELPDGALRLGFEDAALSVRQHAELRARLADAVELLPAGSLVERLRAVKDPSEIEAVRAAAAVADEAFNHVIAEGLVGRTEQEVALALEWEMRKRGASGPSFDSIVAAGAHGALPHAQPRDVIIGAGEMVVIDWGAVVGGYHSDCTRTVSAGAPNGDARGVYDLVLEAQLAGLGAVRAGADVRAVDSTARDVIDAGGYGGQFGHGLGHGVGLDIHEEPRLSQRAEGELVAGNVVTVEPGVYLAGEFGIRIEDLTVVTAEGPEILTSVTKELIVVD
jgi:Xaa-Pro aminopeptidase